MSVIYPIRKCYETKPMLLQFFLTKYETAGGWHWIPISMCRVQEGSNMEKQVHLQRTNVYYIFMLFYNMWCLFSIWVGKILMSYLLQKLSSVFDLQAFPSLSLNYSITESSQSHCAVAFNGRNPPHIRNIKHQPEQTVQLHPHVKIKVISSLNIIWSILLCSVSGRRKDASSLCLSRLIEETIRVTHTVGTEQREAVG